MRSIHNKVIAGWKEKIFHDISQVPYRKCAVCPGDPDTSTIADLYREHNCSIKVFPVRYWPAPEGAVAGSSGFLEGGGMLIFYDDLYHLEINHSSSAGHIFSCKIDQGIYLLAFKGYITDGCSATAGITNDLACSHRRKRIVW